jgi:hypothetical protein
MSWRSVQLSNDLCEQDQLIVNLCKENLVNYVGTDAKFAQLLHCYPLATNLVSTIQFKIKNPDANTN